MASTVNLTLAGVQTVDGIPLSVDDLVLVKDQTNKTENGLYYVKTLDWVRHTPLSLLNVIQEGAVNVGMVFFLNSNDPITVGTSEIVYTTTVGSQGLGAGSGIDIENNLIKLEPSGVTAGTYKSVSVDTYGRVTGATNPTTLSGYGITDAAPKTHSDSTSNPHGVTKTHVGLGNCDNTSDADKPVSTAQATALDGKAAKGSNSDITSLSGLTTALSVAQGGTGATDAAAARTNLGAAAVNAAATITYGANGVSTIATDGTTYAIAYNANGTINTISDGTTTRTCSYSGGNLVGIA